MRKSTKESSQQTKLILLIIFDVDRTNCTYTRRELAAAAAAARRNVPQQVHLYHNELDLDFVPITLRALANFKAKVLERSAR